MDIIGALGSGGMGVSKPSCTSFNLTASAAVIDFVNLHQQQQQQLYNPVVDFSQYLEPCLSPRSTSKPRNSNVCKHGRAQCFINPKSTRFFPECLPVLTSAHDGLWVSTAQAESVVLRFVDDCRYVAVRL